MRQFRCAGGCSYIVETEGGYCFECLREKAKRDKATADAKRLLELEAENTEVKAFADCLSEELDKADKKNRFAEQRMKQILFIAKGRRENDIAPKFVTTDWDRLIAICEGFIGDAANTG